MLVPEVNDYHTKQGVGTMESDHHKLTWFILLQPQVAEGTGEESLTDSFVWHPSLKDAGHVYPNLLDKVAIVESIEDSKN